MKIALITIGKTRESYLIDAINDYMKRLSHYNRLDMYELPSIKKSNKLSVSSLIFYESELISKQLNKTDYVILLDEKGQGVSSLQFANKLNNWFCMSKKRLVFVIGGAYGFSDKILKRANEKVSLSKMTFSHQMVRIIFLEQLYRSLTIIKNEPYHNN